jgi:Family of unknown function (DUF6214)
MYHPGMARFERFTPAREDDGTIAFVPLGNDFVVPRRFAASAGRIALDIEVTSDGAARCVGLIVRPDEGEALTTDALRRIPLARMAKEAVAEAARSYTPVEPGGEPIFRLISTPRDAHEAFYESYVGTAREPRRGSPITDDNLHEVARVYREATKRGDPPTQAVASAMHVARSTAARWVTAARSRGFLGPAMRGKGGEA